MANDPNDKQTPDRRTTPSKAWAVRLVHHPTQQFVPPADIIERDDKIIILVEIAGMNGDSFKIALYNQSLLITGTRDRPDFQNAAYHQAEIGFGDFRLNVPMPWSIERDEVTASYNNGFLRIELPRQQARRVHIVDVNTEDEQT